MAKLKVLLRMGEHEPLHLSQDLRSIMLSLKSTLSIPSMTDFQRSDVVVAEERIKRALSDEKLAESEALEDWEFAATLETERTIDEPIGMERERFLGMGIKIPLPIRKQGVSRIAEAKLQTVKAGQEFELIKTTSIGEIQERVAELEATRRSFELLQSKVLPQLIKREFQIREAYDQGLADFNQIVLVRQQRTRTHKALTRASLDQALAMARLQHALGSNPQLTRCREDECVLAPLEIDVSESEPKEKPIQAVPVKSASKPKKKLFGGMLRKR